MSNDELLHRIEALEADNACLRRLLDREGSTAGLRHQVRNTLSGVRDVIRQSMAHHENAEDFAAHQESRLDAVFRIQTTIANGLADGVDLATLIADELLAQSVREGERLTIEGPGVLLRPEAVGTVGLAVHELVVNAIKFGALSTPDGRLAVRWSVEGGESDDVWLMLNWKESGVGDAPPSPPRRGFGLDLIERGLTYQLGGKTALDFVPGEGLTCVMKLPLSPRIGRVRSE